MHKNFSTDTLSYNRANAANMRNLTHKGSAGPGADAGILSASAIPLGPTTVDGVINNHYHSHGHIINNIFSKEPRWGS